MMTQQTEEQFHANMFGMIMTSLNEPPCTPVYSALFSYRMQSLTGGIVSNKNIFKTIILSTGIALAAVLVTHVYLLSTYGMNRLAMAGGATSSIFKADGVVVHVVIIYENIITNA